MLKAKGLRALWAGSLWHPNKKLINQDLTPFLHIMHLDLFVSLCQMWRPDPKRFSVCSLICLLVVVFSMTLAWSPAKGQEIGEIIISVRDVETGYASPAFISISKVKEDGSTGPVIDSFQATSGEILKTYPAGKYIIELQMEGYKPMKSWFVVETGKKTVDRFMLSPVESKERELQLKAAEAVPSNMAVVSGYVTDDETGQPLAGVRIKFIKTGIEIYTDNKGFFSATVPTEQKLRVKDMEFQAVQEDMIFLLAGYKTLKEINCLITSKSHLKKNVTMFKGKGDIVHDRTHKLLLPPEKLKEIEELKKRRLLFIPLEYREP